MATLPVMANAASDAFAGGLVSLRVQFETYQNSGQACSASGVTISILASGAADGGSGSPVPVTSAGVQQLGEGLYQYDWAVPEGTPPGSYVVTWSGTRTTDSMAVTYSQAVSIAADPVSVPLPGVYASVAQYRNWSGDQVTPASRVQVALQRATEQMDVALVAAVYRVDADGMPQDAALANCLARATSAQAQYIIAVNDDANVKREYASTSVAGVSTSRTASMQGLALPPVAPQALAILRVAGVLPAAPMINW